MKNSILVGLLIMCFVFGCDNDNKEENEYAEEMQTITYNIQPGYNMISYPGVEPVAASEVFPNAESVYKYNTIDSSYVVLDSLHCGVGIYAMFFLEEVITVECLVANTIQIELEEGVNLIGVANFPVELSEYENIHGLVMPIYTWNAELSENEDVTTLYPGKGYWVKVSEPATLNIYRQFENE